MGVAWVPITVVAALSQAMRNAMQRSLKGRLSTNGAAFTRFVFGLPFACVYAFRERPSRAEILGLALLAVSIALVLNGGR